MSRSRWLFSLQAKLFFAFIGVCLLVTSLISASAYYHIRSTHLESLRQHLIELASIASLQLDGDDLQSLVDENQQGSPQYEKIRNVLVRIADADPKVKYIYTMRKTTEAGIYAFIVDADPDPDSRIGEVYDGRQVPAMEAGFIRPSADEDFITDKWGSTLSGYAPVINSEGQVVAILGVDMDATFINEMLDMYARRFIGYSLLAFGVAAATSIWLSSNFAQRINEISTVIKQMTQGNLQVTFAVTEKDEIAELEQSINHLATTLYSEREQTMLSAIEALIQALEAKDAYTHGHSSQVAEIATEIAQAMELSEEDIFKIRLSALLHDIGKIGVPDEILRKESRLTDEEWCQIKEHPGIGARIVSGISSLRDVAEMVMHHHARWDGTGYPEALSGTQIPIGSRIIAVADSFQAITSDRTYHKGKSTEEALAEIVRCRGTQFDPYVVDVFLSIYKQP